MTRTEMRAELGIKRINYVSRETVVVEFASGGARPATTLERRMLRLLDSTFEDA